MRDRLREKGDSLMQVHHISLLSKDFQQNYHFYVDILGLRLIKNSINQGNIYMRHVYYGDFLGTPGTVITFFPDTRFARKRVDGTSHLSGIKLQVPSQTLGYWQERLEQFGIATEWLDGHLMFEDFDHVSITLSEATDQLTDWRINKLTDIPAMMQITGIVGTDLLTDKPEVTLQFIQDMIGDINGLDVKPSKRKAEQVWGGGAVDHVAFTVADSHALDLIWAKAEQLKYHREMYVDRGYFNSVYLLDPNGNRIEFATTGPGFMLDEAVKDLGTTLALPPRFEKKRAELLRYYQKKGVNFKDEPPYNYTDDIEFIEGDGSRDSLK